MAQALPARSAVPVEHTWDATSVFPSDQAWEAEIARVGEQLPSLTAFRDHLADSPQVLADWFEASEQTVRSAGHILVYAIMFHTVNTQDQSATAKYGRATALFSQVMAAAAFAEPEIVAIGFDRLRQWMVEEPRLAIYGHYFDQLERRRSHILSAEVEEVLSLVTDPFTSASQVHGTLANADLRFKPARSEGGDTMEVAQSTIASLLAHRDREVRRTAWENYADAHLAFKNTMANCLTAGVKQNVFFARARGYSSALEAALSPNHIPTDVFHTLIDTYRRNLPIWHRYWRVRRQALGYETLHEYDVRAPLTTAPPQVSFDQAVEWICAGMQPLGASYCDPMRRGLLEQRWVDIYPNEGKRAGAFSSGWAGTHPFILMSYNDDIFSMSVLAHELGHSLHSYHTWKAQPSVYTDYGLFVAEVASNFNQALVRAHLMRTSDDPNFQIAVIEEAMANFHRYFFVMPALARFELEIHARVERGEALTADGLSSLMADLFREGYGDEVQLDADRTGITWAEFATHLYSNFYVYQYATGISAANALAKGVDEQAPGAVDNYLAFLEAGSSLYPIDALKLAGVDMTSPEPIERAFGVLAGYVDRLEQLTGKKGE